MTEIRDTIPRLAQLVPHMRSQLRGLQDGSTFEEVRLRYIETVDQLVAAGLGRRTASRVQDRDAYWSPAVEVLEESMRLGFLERQPLPSARKYLDTYRDKRFELTSLGQEVAALVEADVAAFFNRLAEAAVAAHPYLKQFLLLLREGPVLCPEISE